MTLFKFILSSLVFFLLWIRSTLYSLKLFKIYSFNVPIIAIGNIAIGGTGKTPLTIHLSQLLSKQKIKHVIVTRGFGKKSKGTFYLEHDNKNSSFRPTDVGDEPLVIFNKIKEKYPYYKLYILGDGEDMEKLIKVINENKLSSKALF